MRYARLLMSCAAASATLLCGAVLAQENARAFPSRPVTIIVPFASGGSADIETRVYAPRLGATMGQPFLVDYKIGASGVIGSDYVAKSKRDGYTLLVATGNLAVLPALDPKLPFDVLRDFAPVTQMSQQPFLMTVSAQFPAKTFLDYVAYAKANPGKINFGTGGGGSIQHLVGAWIHSVTNTKVTFIGYKGIAPMLPDLISGRLDITPASISPVLALIKSGKARGLAVLSDKRSKLLPDVQTVVEQGIKEINYTNSLGFVTTGGTPAAIVNRLNEGFVRVSKAPDVVATVEADGGVPVGNTPAQYRQVIVGQMALWRKVIQDNGIKPE